MNGSEDQTSDQEVDSPFEPPLATAEPATVVRPLRIWLPIVLLVLMWSLRMGATNADELTIPVMMARFMAPLVLSAAILLWWVFFSRALMREKLLGGILLLLIIVVTTAASHRTVIGFGTAIFAIPWGMTAFAIGAILTRHAYPRRTIVALLAAAIGFGYWDLIRTDVIMANFDTVQRWRWEPSPESRFMDRLASRSSDTSESRAAVALEPLAESEWPTFRGPGLRGEYPGVVLDEDWDAHPPRETWRQPVGPGWSSFSVAGNRLFTQEQRDKKEAVICLSAIDGSELWAHEDDSRFWEVVGGSGPRATPTIADGSLYTLGANGLLNRLEPVSGELIWQADIGKDAGRDPPQWGFSSSPLVTHGVVIVHAGGKSNKGLLAYDQESGRLRWSVPSGDHTYSSPQLSTLLGKATVLMLTNDGVDFVDPENGAVLGQHPWKYEGYRVVQPLVIDDSSVLIGTTMGEGTKRAKVSLDGEKFATENQWWSMQMSPYFNDYVSHQGYLYGFDNNIFACVDLSDGQRQWKRGRYGNGQVLLLPSGDQLLLTTERGDLVLLRADPQKLTELARHPVLEGRTWNHPVLIGNRLYVRNSEEAACFELQLQQTASSIQ